MLDVVREQAGQRPVDRGGPGPVARDLAIARLHEQALLARQTLTPFEGQPRFLPGRVFVAEPRQRLGQGGVCERVLRVGRHRLLQELAPGARIEGAQPASPAAYSRVVSASTG
jgi:hypothetical protein